MLVFYFRKAAFMLESLMFLCGTKGGTPSGASGGTLGRESMEGIYGRTDAGGQLLIGYGLLVKSFFMKRSHHPVKTRS